MADVQLSIVVRARDLATKTIANIGPTAQRAGALARRAFDSMSGGIKAVGAGIAKMLTPGFGKLIALFAGFQVIRSMVRHAHDFRIAMAEVSTIVDTSAVSMEVLTRGVRELAKAHGAHEQVVAKGLYQAISAGVEAGAKSLIFLERASELAIAGVADTEQAVDVLTTVLNAYGLQVEQATRVSDVLFKTVELGKTTIPELAQNLGQAIPFAATLGTTLEEVAAIMATVTKGGINTAEAATGIKSVMAALINPVQDAADALQELGINVSRSRVQATGFAAVLAEIIEKTRGNDEAITRIFPNIRALGPIFAITGKQADEFRKILEQLKNAAGATKLGFEKQMAEPAKRLDVILNSLKIRFSEIGHTIITEAVRAVDSMAGGAARLEKNLGIVADVVGELAGAGVRGIGRLLEAFDGFIEKAGGADRVSGILTRALRVLTTTLELGFVTLRDGLMALIDAIALMPQAFRAMLLDIPGMAMLMGVRTRENVLAEIEELEGDLAQIGDRIGKTWKDAFELDKDRILLDIGELRAELERLPPPSEDVFSKLMGITKREPTKAMAELKARLTAEMKDLADFVGSPAVKQVLEEPAEKIGEDLTGMILLGFTREMSARAALVAAHTMEVFARALVVTPGFVSIAQGFGTKVAETVDDGISLGMRGRLPRVAGIAEFMAKMFAQVIPLVAAETMRITNTIELGIRQGLQRIRISFEEIGQQIVIGTRESFRGFFRDLITGARSAGEAFREFARSIIANIADILAQIAASKITSSLFGPETISFISSIFGAKEGGVVPGKMTMMQAGGIVRGAMRALPARHYQAGGVARGPQLALFGEGPGAEAFVPLPGPNRGIPVEFKRGASGTSVEAHVTLNVGSLDPSTAAAVILGNMRLIEDGIAGAVASGTNRGLRQALAGR